MSISDRGIAECATRKFARDGELSLLSTGSAACVLKHWAPHGAWTQGAASPQQPQSPCCASTNCMHMAACVCCTAAAAGNSVMPTESRTTIASRKARMRVT